MESEYLVPGSEAASRISIKNSRFIGRTACTPTVAEAREFIRRVSHEEPGHSHAVYAYIIGHGNTVTCGMSDAGEPPGTAGRPLLEVLKGSGIGDITLVVVRYFGGTKLGTGGLVRAYTQSAQETLRLLKVVKKTTMIHLELKFAYDLYNAFENIISESGGEILEKDFTTDVFFKVAVPERVLVEVRSRLLDAAGGKVEIAEKNESDL